DAPDTVFVNGKIHTMDDENTVVSAVSIRDGRFAEVGHASRGQHGHDTKVIDLRGRTVVPGIIDNHNHIVLMGNRPGYHTPLENALSIQDVQRIYAARVATLPPRPAPNWDQWITTIGGFHTNHLYANANDKTSGRFPTLPDLGAAHEDNFTMHIPFLQIYDQGKGTIRLRINFLHMEADQNTPELVQRLKNAFPFIGNEWVKTGGIGEFIAQGVNDASPFKEAAKKVARAGWRAEVHSLGRRNTPASAPADFEFEIQGFEAANAEVHGIVRDRRWVIAHVPGVTQEWIDRLQAIGGNLSLSGR